MSRDTREFVHSGSSHINSNPWFDVYIKSKYEFDSPLELG